MLMFDKVVSSILLEDDGSYDFDVKKIFYIIPGNEDEFLNKLNKLASTPSEPLTPSGLPPSRRPMYQIGDLAGRISDTQLWAEAILSYYETHSTDNELDMQLILRNCRVKPTDLALHNFYKDIKSHFGDIVEYKIPERKKGVERAKSIAHRSPVGSLFNAVFKGIGGKKRPFRIGSTIK